MNYEEDIRIDDSALDVEWLEQASLMMKYSKNAARTGLQLDKAKENLDVVKAQIDRDIRANPDKYKIDKVTEGSIQAVIITEQQYKDAYSKYLDAKYEYDIAQAAVRAVAQRKDALENLVKLFIAQYFAGPKMPRDLTFEAQKRQKQEQSNKSVGEALTNEGRRRS